MHHLAHHHPMHHDHMPVAVEDYDAEGHDSHVYKRQWHFAASTADSRAERAEGGHAPRSELVGGVDPVHAHELIGREAGAHAHLHAHHAPAHQQHAAGAHQQHHSVSHAHTMPALHAHPAVDHDPVAGVEDHHDVEGHRATVYKREWHFAASTDQSRAERAENGHAPQSEVVGGVDPGHAHGLILEGRERPVEDHSAPPPQARPLPPLGLPDKDGLVSDDRTPSDTVFSEEIVPPAPPVEEAPKKKLVKRKASPTGAKKRTAASRGRSASPASGADKSKTGPSGVPKGGRGRTPPGRSPVAMKTAARMKAAVNKQVMGTRRVLGAEDAPARSASPKIGRSASPGTRGAGGRSTVGKAAAKFRAGGAKRAARTVVAGGTTGGTSAASTTAGEGGDEVLGGGDVGVAPASTLMDLFPPSRDPDGAAEERREMEDQRRGRKNAEGTTPAETKSLVHALEEEQIEEELISSELPVLGGRSTKPGAVSSGSSATSGGDVVGELPVFKKASGAVNLNITFPQEVAVVESRPGPPPKARMDRSDMGQGAGTGWEPVSATLRQPKDAPPPTGAEPKKRPAPGAVTRMKAAVKKIVGDSIQQKRIKEQRAAREMEKTAAKQRVKDSVAKAGARVAAKGAKDGGAAVPNKVTFTAKAVAAVPPRLTAKAKAKVGRTSSPAVVNIAALDAPEEGSVVPGELAAERRARVGAPGESVVIPTAADGASFSTAGARNIAAVGTAPRELKDGEERVIFVGGEIAGPSAAGASYGKTETANRKILLASGSSRKPLKMSGLVVLLGGRGEKGC